MSKFIIYLDLFSTTNIDTINIVDTLRLTNIINNSNEEMPQYVYMYELQGDLHNSETIYKHFTNKIDTIIKGRNVCYKLLVIKSDDFYFG